MTLCWILSSTHKHHIVSIQYQSHKCLPEKSRLDCLRILIMLWLFKDPVVIMKEIMYCLFKDPIVTVAWLNLNMPNKTVKNGLKRPNFPKWIFFLEKQLIKFSCTYWPLPFYKILKEFLEPIQSYDDVPFSGPKWPICPEQIFFGANHYYYFHLPIDPCHCAKFNAPNKKFFEKNY